MFIFTLRLSFTVVNKRTRGPLLICRRATSLTNCVFVVCVCSGISLQRHVRVHVLPMLRHGSDVPRDPEHYRVAAASRHVTDDDNGRH